MDAEMADGKGKPSASSITSRTAPAEFSRPVSADPPVPSATQDRWWIPGRPPVPLSATGPLATGGIPLVSATGGIPFASATGGIPLAPIPPAPQPGSGAVRPVDEDDVDQIVPAALRRSTELLREAVAALSLPLDVEGADQHRQVLVDLADQLDDYLLPRLRRIDAPVLAVVGGSTGVGKSTLVNSLLRRVVTRSGVLRPTTRSPVLIHHPYDAGAFVTSRVLPGFARVSSDSPEPLQPIDVHAPRVTALRLVSDTTLSPGLALVDAPDIDSLVDTNRDLARQLMSAADLWIFVTTAARYADAVPWDKLRGAVDRGVSVAIVLDRVPPEAMNEVRRHLAAMLRERDLSTAPVFTIPEVARDNDGFLPVEVVAPLLGWLNRLARDARARDIVIQRTLVGVLDSLQERVPLVADAADAQVAAEQALRTGLAEAFTDAVAALAVAVTDGALTHGDVLARWQRFAAGTPESAQQPQAEPFVTALRAAVAASVHSVARAAVERVEARWREDGAGAGLLATFRHAPGLPADIDSRLAAATADWHHGVLELAAAHLTQRPEWEPEDTPIPAPPGAAAVLMFAACCPVAGTAPDDPVAEPLAAARATLESAFGVDPAPSLVEVARAELLRRAELVLIEQRERFEQLLDSAGVRNDLAAALRTDLRAIEGAR